MPLAESIDLLLRMLRDSGAPQKIMAVGGQLQQNLPQGRSFQLLRLSMDPDLKLIPEISGNRLMLSIRLLRQESDGRLRASTEDAAFELTLCS
jgi:cell division protein ZapD